MIIYGASQFSVDFLSMIMWTRLDQVEFSNQGKTEIENSLRTFIMEDII